MLVIGAGSGRDVLPLVERGFQVTGIEPASTSLNVARRLLDKKGLSATLIDGFFEDVPVTGRFDAVIFSFYSYSYIPESRRRIAALRKASAHLSPGGHVLVSYPPVPPPHPTLIRLARAAGVIAHSDWRLEPGDLVTVHGGGFQGYGHAFQPGEIEREAAAAELRCVYSRGYPDPVAALAPTTSSGMGSDLDFLIPTAAN